MSHTNKASAAKTVRTCAPSFPWLLPLALVMGTALLTGCASEQIHHQVSAGRDQAASAMAAQTAAKSAELAVDAQRPLVSTLPYVNSQRIPYQASLPPVFNREAVAHVPQLPAWQFAAILSSLTGMHVHLSSDILYAETGGGSGAAAPVPADATLKTATTGPSSQVVRTVAALGPLNFTGTTHGLFSYLSEMLGARWKYDADTNTVRIFRSETRVFHIDTLPGDTSISSALSGGGSGGQDIQGGQGQTIRTGSALTQTAYKGSLSVWTAVSQTIRQMLSPNGTMTVSQPLAQITVHDSWRRVDSIARYIKRVNRTMSQQVEVNIKVYEVSINNSDNHGISWQALYNSFGQLASNAGVSIITPSMNVSNTGTMVITPPALRNNGNLTPWASSQFFVQALSTLGHVTTVSDVSVDTVNNTPAPFKTYLLTSYLASTTPSLYTGAGLAGATGASAGLTPGSVETGLTLQVLPSVQPDGQRVLTQISLSISNLNGIQTVASAGESIQVPQVSGREWMQRVMLRSGQSFVMAGLESSQNGNTISTPFGKGTWVFGGNRALTHTQDAVILVITPVAVARGSTL